MRRRKMKQLSIFDIDGIDKPKPKSSKHAMDDRSSMHREPPLPLPTAPTPGVNLTGGDAVRILEGEPRDKVIAEREQDNEVRRSDKTLHMFTFINIGDKVLTYIDPVGRYRIRTALLGSVWMRPANHEKLDDEVRRVLVPSAFAMRLVLNGKIKPTVELIKTFVEAGLLDARSTLHELRPTDTYDDTVEF